MLPWHLGVVLLLALPSFVHTAWKECNAQGSFPGLYGNHAVANLTYYKSQLLSKVYLSFNPAATHLAEKQQFQLVYATVNCPPGRDLQQYGSNGSTAQFCDLAYVRGDCVVYSIGTPGNYAFEQAVVQNTKCSVHTFDCSGAEVKVTHSARHLHHKVCLGTSDSSASSSTQVGQSRDPFAGQNQASLGQAVAKLNHLQGVDAAYLNLEGPRLLEFLSELKHGVPVPRQLSFLVPPHFYKQTYGKDVHNAPAEMALVMQHLAGLGYAATYRKVDPDSSSAVISFIRVERVSPYSTAMAEDKSKPAAVLAATKTLDQQLQEKADALPKAKRLVVSMTSFPGRAEFANPAVYSIMHGLRKPDAFYFWIVMNVTRFDPNDREVQGRKQPDEVKRLIKQYGDRIKIKTPLKDYGPHTKLLPTLLEETDPDTIIITVDDDTFYRPDTVLALEQEILNRPGHAIARSCEVTHWDPTKKPPQNGGRERKHDAGICRGVPTGGAGLAYRRGFFDDLVFDQERAAKGCLLHDDIWFGAHLWLRNIPIWVLPGFGANEDCDKAFGRCWPVMYQRPHNRMSISTHPETDQMGHECLDFFKWLDDNELRETMLADKGLQPYTPF